MERAAAELEVHMMRRRRIWSTSIDRVAALSRRVTGERRVRAIRDAIFRADQPPRMGRKKNKARAGSNNLALARAAKAARRDAPAADPPPDPPADPPNASPSTSQPLPLSVRIALT